jgi:hypothetical protein
MGARWLTKCYTASRRRNQFIVCTGTHATAALKQTRGLDMKISTESNTVHADAAPAAAAATSDGTTFSRDVLRVRRAIDLCVPELTDVGQS